MGVQEVDWRGWLTGSRLAAWEISAMFGARFEAPSQTYQLTVDADSYIRSADGNLRSLEEVTAEQLRVLAGEIVVVCDYQNQRLVVRLGSGAALEVPSILGYESWSLASIGGPMEVVCLPDGTLASWGTGA